MMIINLWKWVTTFKIFQKISHSAKPIEFSLTVLISYERVAVHSDRGPEAPRHRKTPVRWITVYCFLSLYLYI